MHSVILQHDLLLAAASWLAGVMLLGIFVKVCIGVLPLLPCMHGMQIFC